MKSETHRDQNKVVYKVPLITEKDAKEFETIKAISNPDEAYENGRGGIHTLLRINGSYFLVIIYEPTNNEGFVRTAYITNVKRKERRYRGLQSLKRS